MSKSNKAISEIKNLMVQFGFLKSDDTTPLSFKLEDNTILNTSKLEKGSKIVKINEAFEETPLEDGTYRLKENFVIEVKESEIVSVQEVFVDAKTLDGQQISVEGDSIVPGAKVVVVTDQGKIPAPDGQWELEDGSCVYTVGGMVDHVDPSDVESPEDVAGEMPGVEAPQGGMEVPVGGQKPMPNEMVDMLKEFIANVSKKLADMEQNYSALNSEFDTFRKEPAGKKISTAKTDFNKASDEAWVEDRVSAILALRNKNNKK
jgi:hypothetical protein